MAALAGTVGGVFVQLPWSVRLDTSDKYGTVTDPASAVLDFTGDHGLTVEVWAKVSDAATGILVTKGGDNKGYKLFVNSDSVLSFLTVASDGTGIAAGTSDVANDRWMHLVGVRSDGATVKTYVNGVLDNSVSDSAGGRSLANASDLIIGDKDLAGVTPRDIGLVRIWNVALTATQISDLHDGLMPAGDYRTTNIAGEWILADGTGTTGYDSSGRGNNITFSGTPSWISDVYDTESAEAVGTGDAVETVFSTIYRNVDNDNLTVTVDGAAKVIGEDFSLSPKGTITFGTAPGNTEAVVATYRHYPMVLECGGFTGWSLDWTCETLETTDFISGGNKEYVAGLKSWSGSADRHWVNRWTDTLVGEQVIVKFFHDRDNDKYFDGWAVVTGLSPTTANEGLVDESISFQGTSYLAAESGR